MKFRDFIPYGIIEARREDNRKDGFFGDYLTWPKIDGYSSKKYADKLKSGVFKDRNEKDITAALPLLALAKKDGLSVLDFGGGTGLLYDECQEFIKDLYWDIIEQPELVRNQPAREHLIFHDTMIPSNHDVTIFRNSLQYLEDPQEILQQITSPIIIIDSLAMRLASRPRIVIQKIPEKYYGIEVPARIYHKPLEIPGYTLYATWENTGSLKLEKENVFFRGFAYRRNN